MLSRRPRRACPKGHGLPLFKIRPFPAGCCRRYIDDYVLDGNFALAEFFGLPATKESLNMRLIHTKFEHWLADEASKTEYKRVQKLRREGL